jgi:hypothetical protein
MTFDTAVPSHYERNTCRKKAHMLANVAARLCRDVCLSYDMLAFANERLQTTFLIADVLHRNQTGVALRHHEERFRA